jgi:hypothetical protein
MSDSRQTQRGGANSTNVQAGVVNYHQGLAPADALAMMEQVSRRNIERYADEAQQLIDERVELMRQRIVDELAARETLESVADPGMQYATLVVQREYARTGDEDLAETLVQLLADRSQEVRRSRRQLVLDESLQVASRLTPEQSDILSTVLLTRRPRPSVPITSLHLLDFHLRMHLVPWVSRLSVDNFDFDHLAYSGCASIAEGSCSAASALLQVWTGLWHKGVPPEELPESLAPFQRNSAVILPSLRDPAKVQPNAINAATAREVAVANGVPEGDFVSFLQNYQMSEDEVNQDVSGRVPEWPEFISIWDEGRFKNVELTSVGIAIGHANARRVLGSTWIGKLEVYGL